MDDELYIEVAEMSDEELRLSVITDKRMWVLYAPSFSGLRAKAYRFGPRIRNLVFQQMDDLQRKGA